MDDIFDCHPLQIEVVNSGRPLEFDKGLIYHCGRDLDRALINKRIDGESYFTRFPQEWAIGYFIDGSKWPAIYVMETSAFNRLEREGKARLFVQRKNKKGIVYVEPYPKVKSFWLDDVKEIWVTVPDFKRYRAIAFEDDDNWNEHDQKLLPARHLIKQLIESGKLKAIPRLSRIITLKKDLI